jgi:flagellar export protein FliJ
MPSKLPLDTLIEMARDSTDKAARVLGELSAQRQHAARQLEMLREYRQDYLQRLQSALQSGLSAADCHNYQRFIATLDEAIAQQLVALERADAQLADGRLAWQREKRRLSSFDTLLGREQRAQAVRDMRREQRANDEYSNRLTRRHAGMH